MLIKEWIFSHMQHIWKTLLHLAPMVNSEAIFLYVTLYYISPRIKFCGFNCTDFFMLFNDTPYSVSWKPSAFLRHQSLSLLPGIALFCWEKLCSILFYISSACFINDLNNTGPSTNNVSPSCCDFEDYLSEREASFLLHGSIISIIAFVEIPGWKVLKCQLTWKSQTKWIPLSTCSSTLSKVSVVIHP